MMHEEYIEQVKKHLTDYGHDSSFWKPLQEYKKELVIIAGLNLDPAMNIINPVYSPVHRRPHRDALCMLRSFILMTVLKIKGITEWVERMRSIPLLAILSGFDPDDTPGIGTHYDFMRRIIDGPYQKVCEHIKRRSTLNTGKHLRNIPNEKEQNKDDQNPNQSQSEKLVQELLPKADQPRANDFQKVLEDLLFQIGIIPSINQGLIRNLEHLTVTGDGSILISAASARGKPTCSCQAEGNPNCEHNRSYTSPTATWCYDAYRDAFFFGDRYYHLITSQNGHDFPLLTRMPGGNESDYTLSIDSFDRLLKTVRENNVGMKVEFFCGDGHHDSYAHYAYFKAKQVIPVIPLSEKSKKSFPHLPDSTIKLDTDGTPLCPAGVKMKHLMYNKRKQTHVYVCPVKRNTHRNGKSLYVAHLDECPRKQDCAPQSSLGPLVYIKSDTDPRLYPPLSRDSKRFKEIMDQRSATERCNYLNDTYRVDRAHRNADYGLIRLTLANIVEHAVIRYSEAVKQSSENEVFNQIMKQIAPEHQIQLHKVA